ncbi:MAG: ornithine cyclodeaminase family protein, partial [Acidobacteriota bacterium]
MGTLLHLADRDVRRVLTPSLASSAVESAFRQHATGDAIGPEMFSLHAAEGGFHAKGGGLTLGRRYVAVKVNANFPRNPARHGLPTIQGLVLLFDGERGTPLAVLESGELTALRTAAATVVAARHLAREDARVVVVVGCGIQGRAHVQALDRALRCRRIHLVDVVPGRAEALAAELGATASAALLPSTTLAAVLAEADVCVTCTTAERPFLRRADVRPGTFIAAVGADSERKQELEPELVASATVVPDLRLQAEAIGELRGAIAAGLLRSYSWRAELGEIVAGR